METPATPIVGHTPGPWETMGFPGESIVAVTGALGPLQVVAVLPLRGTDKWQRNMTRADARLISAAPELLHALKAAATMIRQTFSHPDDVDMQRELRAMDQIIAKAEGRNP